MERKLACTHLHIPAKQCTDIHRYIHTYHRQTNRQTNARTYVCPRHFAQARWRVGPQAAGYVLCVFECVFFCMFFLFFLCVFLFVFFLASHRLISLLLRPSLPPPPSHPPPTPLTRRRYKKVGGKRGRASDSVRRKVYCFGMGWWGCAKREEFTTF